MKINKLDMEHLEVLAAYYSTSYSEVYEKFDECLSLGLELGVDDYETVKYDAFDRVNKYLMYKNLE